MSMQSLNSRCVRAVAVALAVAFVSVSCSSNDTTGPSDDAGGLGSGGNGNGLQISIVPNPVPFSGTPITDVAGCASLPHTWFYEQVLRDTTGAGVTITARVDKFDGIVVNNINGITISVPANGSTSVSTRWCSGNRIAHTAQTTFAGTDGQGNPVNIEAPEARLRP
jgi:hypothetical protein